MPSIPDYRMRSDIQGPVESRRAHPSENTIGGGLDVLGKTLQGVGEVLQRRQEQAEVSDLNAKLAQAHSDFTTGLQDEIQKATPGDNTLVQRTADKFDEYMGKIQDGIQTRAGQLHFDSASAELRAHFIQKAAQGQAALAGEKAKNDYKDMLDSQSSALLNDPSSLQMALGMHDQAVQSLVQAGGLPAMKAAELRQQGRQELAKSAVRGWIQLDPSDAKDQINSGKFDAFFDGDVKHQMMKEADVGINAQRIEEERQDKLQEKALKSQRDQVEQDLLAGIMDRGDVSTKDILYGQGKVLEAHQQEHMLHLLETAQKDKLKTDPSTLIGIVDRINLPDGDPNRINSANDISSLFGRGLDQKGVTFAMGLLKRRQTPDGQAESDRVNSVLKYAKSRLVNSNPLLGIKDVQGEENYSRFVTDFYQQLDSQRKGGKTLFDLTDPHSPSYLGRLVNGYVKTPEQILQGNFDQGMHDSVAGDQPPTKPAGPNADQISKMKLEELQSLQGQMKDLSIEQKKAAAARWNELQKGSK